MLVSFRPMRAIFFSFFMPFIWQTGVFLQAAYTLICIDKFSVPSTRNAAGHEKTAFPAWALRFVQVKRRDMCHVHFKHDGSSSHRMHAHNLQPPPPQKPSVSLRYCLGICL